MDDLAKPRQEATVAIEQPSTVAADPRPVEGSDFKTDNYLMYALDHDVPFLADHFGIANMLDYKDLPYKAEVDTIDNYLVNEVKGKRLDNTTEAVKKRLTQLEKVAGIDKLAPTSVRTQQLAAYVEYINKMNAINRDALQL